MFSTVTLSPGPLTQTVQYSTVQYSTVQWLTPLAAAPRRCPPRPSVSRPPPSARAAASIVSRDTCPPITARYVARVHQSQLGTWHVTAVHQSQLTSPMMPRPGASRAVLRRGASSHVSSDTRYTNTVSSLPPPATQNLTNQRRVLCPALHQSQLTCPGRGRARSPRRPWARACWPRSATPPAGPGAACTPRPGPRPPPAPPRCRGGETSRMRSGHSALETEGGATDNYPQ